jgi:AcrR family transcriptional regulator
MAALDQAGAVQLRLRERKKARTRASIQQHAMRLFRAQGYQTTTVEQIAAAAEVSPSTFFRYFATKEDVVLRDDYDRLMLEAFRAQPPEVSPIRAVRAAIRQLGSVLEGLTPEELALEQERAALQLSVPEIRARWLDESVRAFREFAQVVADRVGSQPEALPVRTFVGASLGAMLGVYLALIDGDPPTGSETLKWYGMADLTRTMDEALALLEAGLPL